MLIGAIDEAVDEAAVVFMLQSEGQIELGLVLSKPSLECLETDKAVYPDRSDLKLIN